MWSDIETSKDLLGYSIHASLLKDVITNPKNLPITVGLYGDWGSGKSSILKILQEQLEKDDDTVVVYFDGWSFENFDDAKMALIQGIVDALESNEKFFAKVKDDLSTLYSALLKLRYASLNIDWSQNAVLSRIIAAEMLRGRNYLLADNNLDSILYAVNNKVAMVKDIPALN